MFAEAWGLAARAIGVPGVSCWCLAVETRAAGTLEFTARAMGMQMVRRTPHPWGAVAHSLLLPLVTQEPDWRLGYEGQAHRLDDVEEGGYDGNISPVQQGAETVAEQTANANDEAKKCQEHPSPFQRAWILTVLT